MVLDNDDDLGSTVSLATLKLSLLDAVLTVVAEIGLADTKAMHNARRQTKSVDLEANIMVCFRRRRLRIPNFLLDKRPSIYSCRLDAGSR